MRFRPLLPVVALLCFFTGTTALAQTFTSSSISLPATSLSTTTAQPGTPFPQTISVNLGGATVAGLQVKLNDWYWQNSLTYPLEIMLVGPDGTDLVFFGGNCDDANFDLQSFTNTLTLADSASGDPPNGIPAASPSACSNNATYKPFVNQELVSNSPPACPTFAGSGISSPTCADSTHTLNSVFGGRIASGTWKVYAQVWPENSIDSTNAGSLGSVSLLISVPVASSTTTAISSSNNPSFTGSSVTFTATVLSAGSPVTSGTVTFTDNGSTISGCGSDALSSGSATCTTSFGSEGSHTIQATYNPASGYSSSSGSVSQFVNNHTTVNGQAFCNSGTIAISSAGLTVPYPQHVFVSGLTGTMDEMTLTLNDVTSNGGVGNLKAMLVAPDGKAFVSTANAGGSTAPSSLTMKLSDVGTAFLDAAANATAPDSGTTYLPTYYAPAVSFPAPAPASGVNAPYSFGSATFLSTFGSENLNAAGSTDQQWSLYLSDQSGDTVTVGGYCLSFATSSNQATATALSPSPLSATLGNPVTLTANVTASGSPLAGATVTFYQSGIAAPIGSGTTDSNGNAAITTSPATEGLYNYSAEASLGSYSPSTGNASLQVDQPTTHPSANTFCNNGEIDITASSAQPLEYPSRILVSNLAGTTQSVSVSINHVTHSNVNELAMMLASPGNADLVFWSGVGAGGVTDQNFVIADTAATRFPPGTLSGGTYQPSAGVTLSFPSPAPAPVYAAVQGSGTLHAEFAGFDPNGYWSFFALDNTADGSTGSIGQRCLTFTQNAPSVGISINHVPDVFVLGDTNDTYTINVTNHGPGPTDSSLILTDTLPSGLSVVSMAGTNVDTGWSCDSGTLTCTRSTPLAYNASDPVTLTVSVGSNAPVGSNSITNSATVAGGSASGGTANDPTTVASPTAIMLNPTPGTTLPGASTTFTWTAGASATAYSLYIGSTPGAHDLGYVYAGSSLSTDVNNLPTGGGTVYLTLYSYLKSGWSGTRYQYSASGIPTAATMATPTDGSTLPASTLFTWNPGSGVTQYSLYVGTTPGGNDIAFVNARTGTSASVSIPQTGGLVYTKLYSLISGTYQSNLYKYVAGGVGAPATMTVPTDGSTISGGSAAFQWTAGTGVSQYSLYIGTTPGASDLRYVNAHLGLASTVNGLPTDGSTVYVTLYSLIGGHYQHTVYSYITSP
ncbi:hypothetical protein Acid345_2775 [Candidatus Koribacter versatilis Ellin345]|uniref:Big-1 domain-containing protein n=1 Tax=Koribacter versatilis (strain Ellin345) TaxID=204669 RepID=Q1IMX4_KORVE|nr:Ig-like domain repeat protein [Candidatus Koribacter versatilis]ABF41776.1 hypothetical protein Acid345_2775 [Candidatus Koribacter versatilis Ellin345]